MDCIYTLLMLAAVPGSAVCGRVPEPVNIHMDSRHFVHLLTWEAGPGSPAGLYYRVTFRSYTDGWRMVDSCGQVRYPLLCNLTDVFIDLYEVYYINVTAVSGKETSTPQTYRHPFRPASDTEPEPPSLRLSPCNDSLCVYLQSPSQRLKEVYEKFRYTLNVTNEKEVRVFLNTKGLDTVELKVVPGLQYCVSVNVADRRPANKTAVCSSKPAAANNMNAVIPGVLCLTMLLAGAVVFLFILQRPLQTDQPLVLRSFEAPYEVQLLWPTVESLKRVSLEPDTSKHVLVNEGVDDGKEDEEVPYERLRGCEDVSCEEMSGKTSLSLHSSPEDQFEQNPTLGTETYTHSLKECREPTSPQTTSHILTIHPLTIKTPILELHKNDSALLRSTRGDAHRQEEEEEKEDSDDVNFFSLTLGSQNLEQEEAETENVLKVKPEGPFFVLEALKPSPDIQPTSFESTSQHFAYSESDEDEDTEDEDAFSGYMMRH